MARQPSFATQRGAALLVVLCVVLALMLMGVSAVRTALNAEKASRAERDRVVALQGAEAALDDAERDIEAAGEGASGDSSARAASRASLFAPGSSEGFVDGCGAGLANPALGLCLRVPEPAPAAWALANLADANSQTSVEYGYFTGARMPVGEGTLPARLPRYIIELMPYARAGHDAGSRSGNFYRITAIGFGANPAVCVVLQSYYLKAGALA
jgi:type IV pilus assembly protein PilX